MRRRAPIRNWRGAVTRAVDVITRRPMLLGVLVLAGGAFLLVVGFLATTGPPFQERYRVRVSLPADAPVLRPGQAVRVSGRLAGLVSDVDPAPGGGTVVTANITRTAIRPLPADTEAYVRVHSIVYETYLELRPGTAKTMLSDGGRLQARAGSGVDLLEAVQLFDAGTREHFRETAVSLGVGLAGRGQDLNGALAETPALARDVSAQLGAATRKEDALGNVVAGAANTAAGARGERSDDVAGLIGSADSMLSAVDRRREDLRQTLRLLPQVEDRLLAVAPPARPLLVDVAQLSRDLQPAVRELNAALPRLNQVLARGPVLSGEVDRIADAADPVIREARPVAFDLFGTMTTLGPLNDHLRTLLERVGPYREQYRIPGQPGVRQGSGEIAEAGRRFIDATDDAFSGGLAPGAPAWRVLPVLTARPCQNPFPLPGEADKDTMAGGRCAKGGAR